MLPVRFVLVRPRVAENVGAAARVLRNFGHADWVLVDPQRLDMDAARRLAMGAEDLLDGVRSVPALDDAVAQLRSEIMARIELGVRGFLAEPVRVNAINVAASDSQSRVISASARPIWCIPKNTGVQIAFRSSCPRNSPSGRRRDFQPPSRQTSQAATPIIRYPAWAMVE